MDIPTELIIYVIFRLGCHRGCQLPGQDCRSGSKEVGGIWERWDVGIS